MFVGRVYPLMVPILLTKLESTWTHGFFEFISIFFDTIRTLQIRSLKEAIEQSKDSLQYMKYFDEFWQRIQREGRLIEFDLDVYVDQSRYKAQTRYQDKIKFKNLKNKIHKLNTANPTTTTTTKNTTNGATSWLMVR